MVTLTIIRGLPGSGKSTLAAAIVAHDPATLHVEADMWMVDAAGRYSFDAAKLTQAHAECQAAAHAALAAGRNVVVSNTFSRLWEIRPYLGMAKAAGADVHVIECKGRWANIHNVPQSTIDRTAARWEAYK